MLSIPERPGHRVDGRAAPGLTAPEGSVAQQRGWSTNDRQAEKSRHFPFAFSPASYARSSTVAPFLFWLNAKPINPSTTKTAPATINQCGYCILSSPGNAYFFAFSP